MYQQLAQQIIQGVGGKENIDSLTHCATRLRFVLKEEALANQADLEALDILSIVQAGGQYQIVIGTHVGSVYQAILEELPNLQQTESHSSQEMHVQKGHVLSRLLDVISGSITPLIPAMIGAGMVRAILMIMVATKLVIANSPLFAMVLAASNAVFYFFPILVAFTFANKMKANPYLAVTVVAALLEPNFTALIGQKDLGHFLGLPIVALDYSSQILPAFLAVAVMAYLERLLKKWIPQSLQMIFVPTIVVLIMVPLTVLLLGPVMMTLSSWLVTALNFLIAHNIYVTGLVLGAIWLFIVMFGLHWALLPIMLNNLTTQGSDPLLGMLMATVWSAGGIALGVALKTKDKKLKALALNTLPPCFLTGVSEPILYGIFLKYRKSLVIYLICASLLTAFGGFLKVEATQVVGGLFTVPTFQPVLHYVILILASIILSALAIVLFGYDRNSQEEK